MTQPLWSNCRAAESILTYAQSKDETSSSIYRNCVHSICRATSSNKRSLSISYFRRRWSITFLIESSFSFRQFYSTNLHSNASPSKRKASTKLWTACWDKLKRCRRSYFWREVRKYSEHGKFTAKVTFTANLQSSSARLNFQTRFWMATNEGLTEFRKLLMNTLQTDGTSKKLWKKYLNSIQAVSILTIKTHSTQMKRLRSCLAILKSQLRTSCWLPTWMSLFHETKFSAAWSTN